MAMEDIFSKFSQLLSYNLPYQLEQSSLKVAKKPYLSEEQLETFFISKFKSAKGKSIKLHMIPKKIYDKAADVATREVNQKLELQSYYDLEPWEVVFQRAYELLATIKEDRTSQLIDSTREKMETVINRELVVDALKLPTKGMTMRARDRKTTVNTASSWTASLLRRIACNARPPAPPEQEAPTMPGPKSSVPKFGIWNKNEDLAYSIVFYQVRAEKESSLHSWDGDCDNPVSVASASPRSNGETGDRTSQSIFRAKREKFLHTAKENRRFAPSHQVAFRNYEAAKRGAFNKSNKTKEIGYSGPRFTSWQSAVLRQQYCGNTKI
ncbi:hypothetical protein L7F22_026138 [Adiantum nelumboides]|nr:hypothetical protein [Adiantum nelumboides]